MAEDILKIFFNGREEYLRVIRVNESIVETLSDVKNPVCPLIGTSIKLENEIGRGKAGVVFEIDFPDKGKRRYVVKRVKVDLFAFYYAPPVGFPSKTFTELQKAYQIPADTIIIYNDLRAKPKDRVTRDIVIPLFKKGCIKETAIPRFDGNGVIIFYGDDQICESAYSEFVISLLVGELYRSKRSINFLDTFYFATCVDKRSLSSVKQYTFMEKVDRSLRRTLGCITEIDHSGRKNPNYRAETVECIVVQILHVIGMYQHFYEIVHGDLHDDNVFLEYVNHTTTWNGSSVLDTDYYKYTIGTTSLFLPGGRVCPFIVKIGDWGLACKYTTPKIAEYTTIFTGYDQQDTHGPWLPNFYTTAYDPILIISILKDLNPTNEFIQSIFAWMLGLPKGYTIRDMDREKGKVFNKGTGRPDMKALSTKLVHVSPVAILTDPELMGRYMESQDNFVLLGEIP
jgi:hypothetical protein